MPTYHSAADAAISRAELTSARRVAAERRPSLRAATWQRLAWAVEDILESDGSATHELRVAVADATAELVAKGLDLDDANALLRASVLRIAGVIVDAPNTEAA